MEMVEFVNPRRLITGLDEDGVTHFGRVDEVEEVDYEHSFKGWPRPEGYKIWRLWGHDQLPFELPLDGRAPLMEGNPTPEETALAMRRSTLPPESGMRVTMVRFPPEEEPGPMYWHESVDIIFVLSGTLHITLDSGEEQDLAVGDCLIQQGSMRSYQNRSAEPCVIGAVVLGSKRVGRLPADEAHQMGASVKTAGTE
jgi:quercetin dioxygenase-like cupin family protein